MSTAARKTDLDRVLELVERNPGLPAVLLAWVAAGGEVSGEGPGGEVVVPFGRLVKVLSLEKRLVELVKRGRVRRGAARIASRTSDTGYWPVLVRPVVREEVAAVAPVPRAEAGRAQLARLARILGDE